MANVEHERVRDKPSSVYLRCQGVDNEYVKLDADTLPKDPYDLVYLLKSETAPRSSWRDVAAVYYQSGKLSACITILEESISDHVERTLEGIDDEQRKTPGPPCTRLDLLAALAGAHIMAADSASADPAARRESLQKASDVCSRADKIDIDDPSIWAARGWVEFHAEKQTAVNWFENARDKTVVLGTMGLAAIQLNNKRTTDPSKKDTVSLLTSALQSNLCPPGVWTGLAYALFREGRFKLAKNVARRAVVALVDACKEERLEPLYLLALIESIDKSASSLEHMMAALEEAYEECNGDSDSRILSLLAEVSFSGGDFERAEDFASRALETCDNLPGVSIGGMFARIGNGNRVMALFQLGRAQHHLRKFDEASRRLEEAKKLAGRPENAHIKLNPGILLRLGLLKLATERKEDEDLAQECLERVIKDSNDRCGVARRALGVLIGRRLLTGLKRGRPRGGEVFHRAVSLLKRGLAEDERAKRDVPAQLVYAGLIEENSPKLALEAYQFAMKTLEEDKSPVDPEIWSNVASLRARLGDVAEANAIIKEKIDVEYSADCSTITYNRGRIAEMAGALKDAESIFRSIKKEDPHYLEAVTRIAIITMRDDSKLEETEALLKEAMGTNSTKSVAAALLSKLYVKRKNFREAQTVLEVNRNECDYLALAFSSFMHRFLDSLDQERKSRFLVNHIGAPLVSILKRSKHNSFAANGVGVYFAESKMMPEARDAFTAAGAGVLTAKTARVNLAHTQVHMGHRAISESARVTGRPSHKVVSNSRALFEQAEKLYQDALELSRLSGSKAEFDSHCELLLYVAWAQFEATQFRKSADTLTKLLHLVPSSAVVWFNLGQALLESASTRALRGKTMLDEMKMAKVEFGASRQAIRRSITLDRHHTDPLTRSQFDPKHASHMDKYVHQQDRSHEVNLRNATNEAEDREERRRQSLALLEARQKKHEEEARKEMDLQRQKEEELRKAFQESEAKKQRYKEEHDRTLAEEARYEDDDEEHSGEHVSSRKGRSKRKKKEPLLEDEKPAKKAKREKKLVSARRKISDDSGSEYSDLPDYSGNEGENGVKPSQVDESYAEQEQKPGDRKRFSLAVDDEDSDGDF